MIPRHLFNFAAAVSLLISVTTAALWVRSYTLGYDVLWRSWDRDLEFISCTGHIFVGRYRVIRHDEASFVGIHHGTLVPDIPWNDFIPNSPLHFGSFAAGRDSSGTLSGYGIILPHWLFVMITAIAPAIWLRRQFKHRAAAGHCIACDYNLTANTSGVCPECGTQFRSGT